jgi:uncharacterized protein YbjT (DUF2867 family)
MPSAEWVGAVFGPTGLVGRGVVCAWLADPRVREVRAIARRPLGLAHAKLREARCQDFATLGSVGDALAGVDGLAFCLGVPWSRARGAAEYRTITHDYALAAGRALLAASPQATLHFVSGQLASTRSRMAWARIKGETEVALAGLGLGGAIAWRPALVVDSGADAAPPAVRALRAFGLGRRLTVASLEIGAAMLQATREGRTDGVVENREIRALADRYGA